MIGVKAPWYKQINWDVAAEIFIVAATVVVVVVALWASR